MLKGKKLIYDIEDFTLDELIAMHVKTVDDFKHKGPLPEHAIIDGVNTGIKMKVLHERINKMIREK